MTNEQIYRKWDEKLKQKHPDYDQIEKELLDAWMVDQNQPEIFWRLGSVVYSMSLDLFDTEEIKKKTIEAFRYVEKALKLFEENHLESFEAFKWSSITSGKLALIETDIEEKIKYTKIFLNSIRKCIEQKPNDQLVLFMQGRFQLALTLLTDEERKILKEKLPEAAEINFGDAEQKLRRSIELNPEFIDCYITLAYLLIKSEKASQAKAIVKRGLEVEIINKSDEMIHKELLKIQKTLE
ncbi:hypothetical protein QR98_0082160 [Sarcoptes scabiei]|uniref:Regulator of microtubule dynamics protein 1-like protein n=1 Tax=Sarcoptes scabiei TaxID=52283 RepID=A0A132AGH9_SARSC|nr:hypothetical protein QR98_0082160 [Sarcoptes scabiei]